MEPKKSFWKKYEILIVAIATILAIYVIFFFNQKINFLLGNELIVYLSPHQNSISMHYGDASKADFEVSIDNSANCEAFCSYSFTDRSLNNVIDKNNFTIQRSENFSKSYNLSVKRLGSGQDVYSFDVSCRSLRSFICLTQGFETSRSSIVTVNYDLTGAEKELKKILKQNVTSLLEMLNDVNIIHEQANQKFFELAHKINLNSLTKEKISIDDSFDKTRISIENLRSIWASEDYNKLNKLFNESYFKNLSYLQKSIEEFNKSISQVADIHNSLLIRLSDLSDRISNLGNFANVINNIKILSDIKENIKNIVKISSSIAGNKFENYEFISDSVQNITSEQGLIVDESKVPLTKLFFMSAHELSYENDLLCSLNLSCKEDISIKNAIEKSDNFFKNYPNITLLEQTCDSLKQLNLTFSDIRNKKSNFILENNLTFPPGDFFLKLANNISDSEIRKINNSYYYSFEKIKSDNLVNSNVIGIAEKLLPKNSTEGFVNSIYDAGSIGLPMGEGCFGCGAMGVGAYTMDNDTNYFSLYLLSKINISDKTGELLSRCSKIEEKAKFTNMTIELVSNEISYKPISNIDTNISDNPPVCCVFRECNSCCNDESCKNNPKTFPIILLHGHSLAKDNSPEFSLDSFNKIQSRLQDDGYLSVGTISLYSKNEPSQPGIWGMSGKPVTVKASYYYDAFRKDDKYIVIPTKSENIDTYALRLKDLIEIVKERTGKPKVNIIAHSMGGLVARKYLQIFGNNDVDKLVMIAAPNKGISGSTGDYCGLIGENQECDDMQQNSIFLNKLNDPSNQPNNIKLYAIVGEGCKMKQGIGDGVVLSENEKLENAKISYVDGSCDGFETLHTEILNIDKYPQTYSTIKKILNE